MTSETMKMVLRSRAEALARPTSVEEPERPLELVEFVMGEEGYALPLDRVCMVGSCPVLTPVPMAPPRLAGMCSVRGGIIAVLDLKGLQGLSRTGQEKSIIVLGKEQPEMAILADSVRGLRYVNRGEIQELRDERAEPERMTVGILADGVAVLDADSIEFAGDTERERSGPRHNNRVGSEG